MEKILEVIINVGIPASGKSTQVKQFIKDHPDYVKISRDDFRYMLRDCGWEPKIEKMITIMHNDAIIVALESGYSVIIDNTNVKLSSINEIVKVVNGKANIQFKLFDTPIETCLERDKNRERSVGEDVIKQMYNNLQILKKNFDFKPIKRTYGTQEFNKDMHSLFNNEYKKMTGKSIDEQYKQASIDLVYDDLIAKAKILAIHRNGDQDYEIEISFSSSTEVAAECSYYRKQGGCVSFIIDLTPYMYKNIEYVEQNKQ
jgi:predicted kinase